MIKFEYSRQKLIYTTQMISILSDKQNIVYIKFDTGAAYTVLSFEALFPGITLKEKENFVKKLKNMKIKDNIFYSATKGEMKGYNVKLCNINLGGVFLETFCLWLIINMNHPLALLGDDFISCCNISHKCDSDFIIESFSSDLYNKKNKYQFGAAVWLHEIVVDSPTFPVKNSQPCKNPIKMLTCKMI